MYHNPHLQNSLLPTIAQIKRYFRSANATDISQHDVRPLMSFLQRLPQADQYFFGLIQTRKLAITGYPWEIVFPSDYQPTAEEEKRLFTISARFKTANAERLFDIILNGIIFGISGARLVWENSVQGAILSQISPYDLTELDFDINDNQFYFLSEMNGQVTRAPLEYGLNLLVYFNPLYGVANNYVGSLARVNSIYVLLKYFTRFDWSRLNEKFGQPLIYGQYTPAADPKDVTNLLTDLEKLGSDGYAAIPESIKINLLEAARSGSIETYLDFIKTVNAEMAISILGQNLTTEISDQGSRAAAQVHNFVRNDILFADLLLVERIINSQYIAKDLELNYGESLAVKPAFRFITDEAEDFEKNARILAEVKGIQGVQIPLKQTEVYDKIGFSIPDGTDEVI